MPVIQAPVLGISALVAGNAPIYKTEKRNCLWCNKELVMKDMSDYRRKKFCSHHCVGKYSGANGLIAPRGSSEFKKIEKYCLECGSRLALQRKGDIERKKYCSRPCMMRYRFKNQLIRRRGTVCGENNPFYGKQHTIKTKFHLSELGKTRKGENSGGWKGGKVSVNCLECGIQFLARPYKLKQKRNFCSRECSWSWKSKNLIGENCHSWKGGEITKICPICNKEFKIKACRIKNGNGKFCSRKCFGVWYIGKRVGEKCPFWKGGISKNPYAPTFNKQRRDSVRTRDNFKCQMCGIPELECDKKLNVHHIDYDKKNSDMNNLISLCHLCHSKTNSNRENWIKIFSEKMITK